MSNVVFKSVLKDETALFYDFMKLSVADIESYKRTLLSLDMFLYEKNIAEKSFDAELIARFLDNLDGIKLQNKKAKLGHIRKFSEYLSALGIKTSIPELPKYVSTFEPYVFTSDEIAHIFEYADDLAALKPKSKIAAEIPLLLRILYGCGLRLQLGEATSLTWNDINFENSVITIRIAKNQKQRLCPMCDELTRILKLYRNSHIGDSNKH